MSLVVDFSVQLTVTSGSSSLAPALEWYCRQNTFCSYAPFTISGISCPNARFTNITEYSQNLGRMPRGCNEIELLDGSALYGEPVCPESNCGAVMFRYPDGRNARAYCPSGTEMFVSSAGIPGAIEYIFTPSDGVELSGNVPADCLFVGGGYRCDPGAVTLRFTETDNACDAVVGGCPLPTTGTVYGSCGTNNQECVSGLPASTLVEGPAATPVGPPTEPPGEEFSVQLTVTSGSTSLAPALEWYCQQNSFCSYAPSSLSASCPVGQFTNLTEYSQNLGRMVRGCNEIELLDGSALYGEPVCPESNCGAVMFRYPDGRNARAFCPVGTEMFVSSAGIPGANEYIFTPSSGVELANLPANCWRVGGAYRCESGAVTLRFTESANACDAVVGGCSLPATGSVYGTCGTDNQECVSSLPASTLVEGPAATPVGPPTEPPGEEFSVQLTVTSGSTSLAPALEWYCRQSTFCSYAPDSLSGLCQGGSFLALTSLTRNLGRLPRGCNEIELFDGSALYGEPVCPDAKCGAVMFRYPDGRNARAFCPVGTEMFISSAGIPGANEYIFTPSSGVELSGDLPANCWLVGGAYRCESGAVTLRFTEAAYACDAVVGGCRLPTTGTVYGTCIPKNQECVSGLPASALVEGPSATPVGSPTEPPGDEFSVRLTATSGSTSLAPALEWFCRHSAFCSYGPASLSGLCQTGSFQGLTPFTRNLGSLPRGCNEIELMDGLALYGEPVCPDSNCGAVMFRYPDGRNARAFCPAGTEMFISSAGIPGATEYVFTPSSGVYLSGDLPAACWHVGDVYRCGSGAVSLRFTHEASPCDSSSNGCALPLTGSAYGSCGRTSQLQCVAGIGALDLFLPTESPSTVPSLFPTATPTISPTKVSARNRRGRMMMMMTNNGSGGRMNRGRRMNRMGRMNRNGRMNMGG